MESLWTPIKRIITQSLQSQLDKFASNVDLDAIGVAGGDIVLRDVELRKEVLQERLFGDGANEKKQRLKIERGFIKELRIGIPWTHLMSQPILVELRTIEIVLVDQDVEEEVEEEAVEGEECLETSREGHSANSKNGADVSAGNVGSQSPSRRSANGAGPAREAASSDSSLFGDMFKGIVSNATIEISNVVLKYEKDDVILSASMKSMSIFSSDPTSEDWIKRSPSSLLNDFAYKTCDVKGLTVNLERVETGSSGLRKAVTYEMALLSRCDALARCRLSLGSSSAQSSASTEVAQSQGVRKSASIDRVSSRVSSSEKLASASSTSLKSLPGSLLQRIVGEKGNASEEQPAPARSVWEKHDLPAPHRLRDPFQDANPSVSPWQDDSDSSFLGLIVDVRVDRVNMSISQDQLIMLEHLVKKKSATLAKRNPSSKATSVPAVRAKSTPEAPSSEVTQPQQDHSYMGWAWKMVAGDESASKSPDESDRFLSSMWGERGADSNLNQAPAAPKWNRTVSSVYVGICQISFLLREKTGTESHHHPLRDPAEEELSLPSTPRSAPAQLVPVPTPRGVVYVPAVSTPSPLEDAYYPSSSSSKSRRSKLVNFVLCTIVGVRAASDSRTLRSDVLTARAGGKAKNKAARSEILFEIEHIDMERTISQDEGVEFFSFKGERGYDVEDPGRSRHPDVQFWSLFPSNTSGEVSLNKVTAFRGLVSIVKETDESLPESSASSNATKGVLVADLSLGNIELHLDETLILNACRLIGLDRPESLASSKTSDLRKKIPALKKSQIGGAGKDFRQETFVLATLHRVRVSAVSGDQAVANLVADATDVGFRFANGPSFATRFITAEHDDVEVVEAEEGHAHGVAIWTKEFRASLEHAERPLVVLASLKAPHLQATMDASGANRKYNVDAEVEHAFVSLSVFRVREMLQALRNVWQPLLLHAKIPFPSLKFASETSGLGASAESLIAELSLTSWRLKKSDSRWECKLLKFDSHVNSGHVSRLCGSNRGRLGHFSMPFTSRDNLSSTASLLDVGDSPDASFLVLSVSTSEQDKQSIAARVGSWDCSWETLVRLRRLITSASVVMLDAAGVAIAAQVTPQATPESKPDAKSKLQLFDFSALSMDCEPGIVNFGNGVELRTPIVSMHSVPSRPSTSSQQGVKLNAMGTRLIVGSKAVVADLSASCSFAYDPSLRTLTGEMQLNSIDVCFALSQAKLLKAIEPWPKFPSSKREKDDDRPSNEEDRDSMQLSVTISKLLLKTEMDEARESSPSPTLWDTPDAVVHELHGVSFTWGKDSRDAQTMSLSVGNLVVDEYRGGKTYSLLRHRDNQSALTLAVASTKTRDQRTTWVRVSPFELFMRGCGWGFSSALISPLFASSSASSAAEKPKIAIQSVIDLGIGADSIVYFPSELSNESGDVKRAIRLTALNAITLHSSGPREAPSMKPSGWFDVSEQGVAAVNLDVGTFDKDKPGAEYSSEHLLSSAELRLRVQESGRILLELERLDLKLPHERHREDLRDAIESMGVQSQISGWANPDALQESSRSLGSPLTPPPIVFEPLLRIDRASVWMQLDEQEHHLNMEFSDVCLKTAKQFPGSMELSMSEISLRINGEHQVLKLKKSIASEVPAFLMSSSPGSFLLCCSTSGYVFLTPKWMRLLTPTASKKPTSYFAAAKKLALQRSKLYPRRTTYAFSRFRLLLAAQAGSGPAVDMRITEALVSIRENDVDGTLIGCTVACPFRAHSNNAWSREDVDLLSRSDWKIDGILKDEKRNLNIECCSDLTFHVGLDRLAILTLVRDAFRSARSATPASQPKLAAPATVDASPAAADEGLITDSDLSGASGFEHVLDGRFAPSRAQVTFSDKVHVTRDPLGERDAEEEDVALDPSVESITAIAFERVRALRSVAVHRSSLNISSHTRTKPQTSKSQRWMGFSWRYREPRSLLKLTCAPVRLPPSAMRLASSSESSNFVWCQILYRDEARKGVWVNVMDFLCDLLEEEQHNQDSEYVSRDLTRWIDEKVRRDPTQRSAFDTRTFHVGGGNTETDPAETWMIRWLCTSAEEEGKEDNDELLAVQRVSISVAVARAIVFSTRIPPMEKLKISLRCPLLSLRLYHNCESDLTSSKRLPATELLRVELHLSNVLWKKSSAIESLAVQAEDVQVQMRKYDSFEMSRVLEPLSVGLELQKHEKLTAVELRVGEINARLTSSTLSTLTHTLIWAKHDVSRLRERAAALLASSQVLDDNIRGAECTRILIVNATGKSLLYGQVPAADATRKRESHMLSAYGIVSYSWTTCTCARDAHESPNRALNFAFISDTGETSSWSAPLILKAKGIFESKLTDHNGQAWKVWISVQSGDASVQTVVAVYASHSVMNWTDAPIEISSSSDSVLSVSPNATTTPCRLMLNDADRELRFRSPTTKPTQTRSFSHAVSIEDDLEYERPPKLVEISRLPMQSEASALLQPPTPGSGPPTTPISSFSKSSEWLWMICKRYCAEFGGEHGLPVPTWQEIHLYPTYAVQNDSSFALEVCIRPEHRVEALQYALKSVAWSERQDAARSEQEWMTLDSSTAESSATSFHSYQNQHLCIVLQPNQRVAFSRAIDPNEIHALEFRRVDTAEWSSPPLRLHPSMFKAPSRTRMSATIEMPSNTQPGTSTTFLRAHAEFGGNAHLQTRCMCLVSVRPPHTIINETNHTLFLAPDEADGPDQVIQCSMQETLSVTTWRRPSSAKQSLTLRARIESGEEKRSARADPEESETHVAWSGECVVWRDSSAILVPAVPTPCLRPTPSLAPNSRSWLQGMRLSYPNDETACFRASLTLFWRDESEHPVTLQGLVTNSLNWYEESKAQPDAWRFDAAANSSSGVHLPISGQNGAPSRTYLRLSGLPASEIDSDGSVDVWSSTVLELPIHGARSERSGPVKFVMPVKREGGAISFALMDCVTKVLEDGAVELHVAQDRTPGMLLRNETSGYLEIALVEEYARPTGLCFRVPPKSSTPFDWRLLTLPTPIKSRVLGTAHASSIPGGEEQPEEPPPEASALEMSSSHSWWSSWLSSPSEASPAPTPAMSAATRLSCVVLLGEGAGSGAAQVEEENVLFVQQIGALFKLRVLAPRKDETTVDSAFAVIAETSTEGDPLSTAALWSEPTRFQDGIALEEEDAYVARIETRRGARVLEVASSPRASSLASALEAVGTSASTLGSTVLTATSFDEPELEDETRPLLRSESGSLEGESAVSGERVSAPQALSTFRVAVFVDSAVLLVDTASDSALPEPLSGSPAAQATPRHAKLILGIKAVALQSTLETGAESRRRQEMELSLQSAQVEAFEEDAFKSGRPLFRMIPNAESPRSCFHFSTALSTHALVRHVESVRVGFGRAEVYVDDILVKQTVADLMRVTMGVSSDVARATSHARPASVPAGTETTPLLIAESVTVGALELSLKLRLSETTSMFIGLNDTELKLWPISARNVRCTYEYARSSVGANYMADVMLSVPSLIGSLSLCGNPTGLVRSFALGLRDLVSIPLRELRHGWGPGSVLRSVAKGWMGFFNRVAEGTLTSVSGFSEAVAENLERLRGMRRRSSLAAKGAAAPSSSWWSLAIGVVVMPAVGGAQLVSKTAQGIMHTAGLQANPPVKSLLEAFKQLRATRADLDFESLATWKLMHTRLGHTVVFSALAERDKLVLDDVVLVPTRVLVVKGAGVQFLPRCSLHEEEGEAELLDDLVPLKDLISIQESLVQANLCVLIVHKETGAADQIRLSFPSADTKREFVGGLEREKLEYAANHEEY